MTPSLSLSLSPSPSPSPLLRDMLITRLGVAAMLMLILLLSAATARAQIVPCSGVSEPGFKVLLDDIEASDGSVSPLLDLLVSRLDANLEQLNVEARLPLKVVRCTKRHPESPGEFRKPLVQDLTARRVMLEVWGTTVEVDDGGGQKVHEASIGYALVPIRFYEFDAPQPTAAFLVNRRAKSVSSPADLLQLVDQAGTLAAYSAVAAGTKLLRDADYDGARAQLCKAESLLRAMNPTPPAGSPDAELLAYASRLAADAVAQARADANYQGRLKALPASATQQCGVTP
jgi:hypothetical protein